MRTARRGLIRPQLWRRPVGSGGNGRVLPVGPGVKRLSGEGSWSARVERLHRRSPHPGAAVVRQVPAPGREDVLDGGEEVVPRSRLEDVVHLQAQGERGAQRAQRLLFAGDILEWLADDSMMYSTRLARAPDTARCA